MARALPTWFARAAAGLVSWLCAAEGAAQTPPAPTPVPRDRIAAVLQDLDQRFARGDVAGYLAQFAPDHPGAHAMLQNQLERRVAAAPGRSCRSTILTEPRVIGPRTVVRVQHELELRPAGDTAPLRLVEHALVAWRAGDAGQAVPTFAVDLPTESRRDPDATQPLRCPPCNYEVGGVPGWLCVPMRTEQANALEGASLYLLGTDIACDVSVEVPGEPQTAAAAARELADSLQSLEPTARIGPLEDWLPPHLRTAPPAGLGGAQIAVELPNDTTAQGGGRARFHVVAFGGLQHLLLLRGSARALRDHADAVQALLASYHVLQLDGDAARSASNAALDHHTGGVCDGATYRNDPLRVACDGPAGWNLQQRPGGPLFRVCWTSANGSRLWLTGHRVPVGMPRWTTAAADAWLAQLCSTQGLQLPAEPEWTPLVGCDAHARLLVVRPLGAAADARGRRLRALRFDDLLLVADGFGKDDADDAAILTAMASLRRNP